MKIIFRTNLDLYKGISWPVIRDVIPAVGTFVFVHPASEGYCTYNKIPQKLKIVSVYIHFDHIECDLWYDSEMLKLETDERRNHLMNQ